MKIFEVIEILDRMPAHWEFMVSVPADGSGGGQDTTYEPVLAIVRENLPTAGNSAVVEIAP